ncbi:MAG TPA: hypothetical protein QF509_07675 [Rhodospirillales bacterium]|nr:hypothetical protein [Rhodospirillales bacterium]
MVATLSPPCTAIDLLAGACSGCSADGKARAVLGNVIAGEADACSTPEEEITTVANRCDPEDSCGSPGMLLLGDITASLFSGKR